MIARIIVQRLVQDVRIDSSVSRNVDENINNYETKLLRPT